MTTPSIKGTAFASAVTDLQEFLDKGRLTREQLEARLRPEDVEIVDWKILPGDWYPIESYGRILELLGSVAGGGPAYHLQRGRRTAERLFGSGIYKQLDRAIGAARRAGLVRARSRSCSPSAARSTTSARWEIVHDPASRRRLRFELRQMEALPENARITIQGFVEWAAEHIVGGAVRVESRRTHPDRIQFDITTS